MLKLFLEEFSDKKGYSLQEELTVEQVGELLGSTEFEATRPLQFDLLAKRRANTVTVTGKIHGGFEYECGRCLTLRAIELNEPVDLVYLDKKSWDELQSDEEEVTEELIDVDFYQGREIDLEPALREAILLAFPPFGICPTEFESSCDEALEALMAEAKLDREEIKALEAQALDQRWGPLEKIRQEMFGGGDKELKSEDDN